MLILDLCCGLKGASNSMLVAGWNVVTVDIDPQFDPDIVADLIDFRYLGKKPDLIWASPPCTEFSRESMPWCRTGNPPDMDLVFACKRIIDQVNPKYWVIENVKGAIKYFDPHYGRPKASFGPFFLWGHFPISGPQGLQYRKKESFSSKDVAARAKIPTTISEALMDAIVKRPMLF